MKKYLLELYWWDKVNADLLAISSKKKDLIFLNIEILEKNI